MNKDSNYKFVIQLKHKAHFDDGYVVTIYTEETCEYDHRGPQSIKRNQVIVIDELTSHGGSNKLIGLIEHLTEVNAFSRSD